MNHKSTGHKKAQWVKMESGFDVKGLDEPYPGAQLCQKEGKCQVSF